MSLRLPSARLAAVLTSRLAPIEYAAGKRLASSAVAVAAARPDSQFKKTTMRQIHQQAPRNRNTLSNADVPAGSPSSMLVQEHAPYMVATYVRPPPVFTHGKGCYMWDMENRKFLDFTAGIAVNALGHCDAQVAKVIEQQAKTLIHTSNLYYNPWTLALSKLLVTTTVSSGGMNASRAFICNSGSEANEAAIKFARKHACVVDPSGAKFEIISFRHSFHGRTLGALSATPNPKYQKPYSPLLEGFKYGDYNCSAEQLDELITEHTAGVIVEPIQGEGGIHVATPEFLQALRKRCSETNTILIYDEIQCGLSRTGHLWAHSEFTPSAHPDIVTSAKALGNGFPVAATIVSERVAEKIVPGDHGTTFGGNPLACRVAHHVLTRLADPALQAAVRERSAQFLARFHALQQKYPALITEVRGKGLILGLQLSTDPTPVVTAARQRGLLVITAGGNTLRIVPPLVISQTEVDAGCDILEEAFETI